MADSLSSSLTSSFTTPHNDNSKSRVGSSEVEKQELAKRRRAFWYYFLRGPLWNEWTRVRIEAFTGRFGNTFGLGLVANVAEDYKGLIDEYHYCKLRACECFDDAAWN